VEPDLAYDQIDGGSQAEPAVARLTPHAQNTGRPITSSAKRAKAALYKPVTVDLFCGAGGLSSGFESAGLAVLAHVDNWQPAVSTLNANFSEDLEPVDVSKLTADDVRRLAGGTPDVLAGGPPCQSFTSAGPRRESDPRGTLVGAYARLAAEVRAPLVVFENVEGFVTAGDGRFVFDLLDPLLAAGYRVAVRKINLANYGVPQHRKRVIAVASLLGDPPFPQPTHSAWGSPGAQRVAGRPPTPTVLQALDGLPEPGCECAPQGHVLTSRPGEMEQRRIAGLRPGDTMRDLPEELWHDSYRKRAYRRVMDGTPTEQRGGAPAGLRRLYGDQPSKAITSAAVREFVHPTADRRLTLRDAARLQTFEDSFEFHGSATEQATLVGNAIPPRFAAALGKALREHLIANIEVNPRQSGEGALLEFTVTNAEAMSPALARVVREVRDRYVAETLFASPVCEVV
jgi:DNA (cytosine-5)-methyltransferase 1